MNSDRVTKNFLGVLCHLPVLENGVNSDRVTKNFLGVEIV